MGSAEAPMLSTPWYAHVSGIKLGESPIYRESDSTLHWVDFISKPCKIYILPIDPVSCEVLGPPRVLELPDHYISVIRFRKNVPGSYICAYARGIAFLDEKTGALEVVKELVSEEERALGLGLNDGGIDPQGRFWVGGLDLKVLQGRVGGQKEPQGGWKGRTKLWMYEEGGKCEVKAENVICGNGIGWSPDGKSLYFNDSGTTICWKYDFDGETGQISSPKKAVEGFHEDQVVINDGMVVDQDGNLWIAMWNDHCVKVFTPSGKEIQKITLAAKCVTCTGWAGKNLDSLVITTAQPLVGKTPEGDHGGDLFLQKIATKGMANYEFGRQTRQNRKVAVTSSL